LSLYVAHTSASYLLFNYPSPTHISTLSLHDALPIYSHESGRPPPKPKVLKPIDSNAMFPVRINKSAHEILRPYFCFTGHKNTDRSEEHTSELQSRENLVCRLLLEKKKQEKKEKIQQA